MKKTIKPLLMLFAASLVISGCTGKSYYTDGDVDVRFVNPNMGESQINGDTVTEGVWVNDFTWLKMNHEMNECYYGK